MVWAAWIVGALVGVPLVLAAVGWTLPKGHKAACTLRLRQTPEAIFKTLADFEAMPSWRTDLKRIERLPDQNGHPVWAEHGKNGRIPLEIVESRAPARLVTRIADPTLPFGGSWIFDIKPCDGGADLTITEDGEIHNPIFRVMARFVFGHHATLEAYLMALAAKFGESAMPQRLN